MATPARRLLPCLALSLAALACFILLALSVSGQNALSAYDSTTAQGLRDYRVMAPALTSFFKVLTELGSKPVLAVLTACAGLILAWRKQWMLGAILFIAFVGGCVANELIKEIVQRPRPPQAALATFSFPSGHATGALLAYGLLAYLVLVRVERRGLAYAGAALLILLALLVGYSRIFLTVHYVSDVLGSILLSTACLALAIPALEAARQRKSERELEERPSWGLAADRRGYHGSRPNY